MWPDRVSNPGPLTCESGALPIALRGPAHLSMRQLCIRNRCIPVSILLLYIREYYSKNKMLHLTEIESQCRNEYNGQETISDCQRLNTVELPWLVYHGYFEPVLVFLGKNPIAADFR